ALPSWAANSYWDSNDNVSGAGSATPTGTWGLDPFWSSSSTGVASTTAWTAGDTAFFSAGSDATGVFTVNVSGAQTAGGIKVQEGTLTLSGGAITMVGTGAGVD